MSSAKGKSKQTPTASASKTGSAAVDVQTPVGTRARDRSQSPTVISRADEKNQLASLNDRLAVYIERVRRLEADNERLGKVTKDIEEATRREVNGVKTLYDGELAEARRLLDAMAKDKARFQMDVGRLQSQLQEIQTKLAAREKSEADLKQRLVAAEAQIGEHKSRVGDLTNQKRRLEEENGRLSRELDAVNKQLASIRKELEAETIRRVDLENRNKSLQEEMAFQAQVHRKEIQESMSRRRVEIEEVDGRLQQEYDSKLRESLNEMRSENEELIRRNREELEALYESKIADAQASVFRDREAAQKAQSELRHAVKRCEELTAETSRLSSQVSGTASRLESLERMLQRERDEHRDALAAKDAELIHLKKALEEQLVEYRDLLDVKIQLDAEIATYRKLLELEESRLNISSPGAPGSSKRSTPSSGESSKRRKIVESEESSTYVVDQYSATAASRTGVEIHSVDPEGKYVRLFNNTDKIIGLNGWTLRESDGGAAEVVFKFPAKSQIKPHQVLTIWSQSSSPTHGPNETMMKSQNWLSAGSIKTVLNDSKGEEVACRESRFGTRISSTEQDSGIEVHGGVQQSSGWSFGSLFTVFV